MRKTLAVVVVSALALGGFMIYDSTKTKQATNLEFVAGQANYPQYTTLADLEKDAEVILEVKFTGERENIEVKQSGFVIGTLSKSAVDVLKIHKGTLANKEKTTVYEEAYIKGDRYHHSEGYKLMNERGRYLLFLRTNNVDDAYVMLGAYQGKYDLNIEKEVPVQPDTQQGMKDAYADPHVEFMGDKHSTEKFMKVKKEVVKKYKK